MIDPSLSWISCQVKGYVNEWKRMGPRNRRLFMIGLRDGATRWSMGADREACKRAREEILRLESLGV